LKAEIESIIQKRGFSDYKWINPKEIVVAQWVRVKCMFGCGDFGSGTCPPNTPSVAECESFFKEYESAVLVRLTIVADKNSYPSDWSREMTNKLLDIEKEIFLRGHTKVFLLNQTCCTLCKECSGSRATCKNKALSRPSPESFAVDVYQTAGNAQMALNVVADNPAEMQRIAILLIK
jgi:predicted metal-binding protein